MDEILKRIQSRSGLTPQHAEIMLLIAGGAGKEEIQKTLGRVITDEYADIRRTIGNRRQVCAFVAALWRIMEIEQQLAEINAQLASRRLPSRRVA